MAAPEAPQSRLLALPRELRDEIYTLAFESTEVDLAWNGDKHRNNGIILASKHTYEETIDLYYKHTPFLAFFDRTLALWLINLPISSRELLGELRISHVLPDFLSPASFEVFQDAMVEMFVDEFKMQGIMFGDGVIKCRSGLGPQELVTWVTWPFTDS